MPPLEHLIGKPIRYNFNGDPVGVITDARVIMGEPDAIQVTMDIFDEKITKFLSEDAEHFSFIGRDAGP